MEKSVYIKKVNGASLTFEYVDRMSNTYQLTMKANNDSIIDHSIKYLGKKVRINYVGGVVTDMQLWEEWFNYHSVNFRKLKAVDYEDVESGLISLSDALKKAEGY